MVDTDGRVVVAYQPGPARIVVSEMVPHEEEWAAPRERCASSYVRGAVPDIHHPATRGWLLAMLREATGCVDLAVVQDGDTWETMPMYGDCYATEGEALAAALLAVWGAA